MPVTEHLLEVLRCPESRGELTFVATDGKEYLVCKQSKLRYRIEDGIPVMLASEAERLDAAECEALLASAMSMN